MIAPELPASPHGTETKGEVEMASAFCCVSAARSFKREWKQNQRNPFLYTSATTLFTSSIRNTRHAFLRPSPPAAQLSVKEKKKGITFLAWPPLFAVSYSTPLPRLLQLNLLSKHLCFASYQFLILSLPITTGETFHN